MKKLLTLVMASFISITGFAQTKPVQIVWPFAIGSAQANMIRSIIESANSQQDKYQFIFVNKPGAGGTVAAISTLESHDLAILASTSSFYIRPLLYKDSHDVDKFKIVSSMCVSQPLAIFSKKVSKLNDREVTLGVIPGSITTLVSRAIQRENPNLKILEVPYKGTPEATTDMLGGHVDGSVDFIGKSVLARFGNDIMIVGMTGTRGLNGNSTFQSLGVKGLDNVVNDYFFFVPNTIDSTTRHELNIILGKSINNKAREFCEEDYGVVQTTPYTLTEQLHKDNKVKWDFLTRGIPKE